MHEHEPLTLRVDSINGIPWPIQGDNESILKIDLRIGFDLNISVTAEEELQG
jgi:hypothetical protein